MLFIKRSSSGEIETVSREPIEGGEEVLSLPQQELDRFLGTDEVSGIRIEDTDQAFIRVLEDVVELLIDKGVFMFTELPESAQQRMLERQRLRSERDDRLSLLGSD